MMPPAITIKAHHKKGLIMLRRTFILVVVVLLSVGLVVVNAQENLYTVRAIQIFDFNAVSNKVATAHIDDQTIRIWDRTSGQLLNTIDWPSPRGSQEGPYYIKDLVFNPSGTQIAASFGSNALIQVIDANTGQVLTEIEAGGFAGALDWNPNETQIVGVVVSGLLLEFPNSTLKVWDIETAALQNEITISPRIIASVDWSPDGTLIAYPANSQINIVETSTWQNVAILEGHSGIITSVNWNPDGTHLASTDPLDTRIWDISIGQQQAIFPQVIDADMGIKPDVQWSSDGTQIAFTGNETISVYDVATEQLLLTVDTGSVISNLAWAADGDLLYSSGEFEVNHFLSTE